MGQQHRKENAGGANQTSKGSSAKDRLLQKVENQRKAKIAQVRQDEHDRQMGEWYRGATEVHGGDCQD